MRYASLLLAAFALAGNLARAADLPVPIRPVQRIALPGVEGRIDHMAVDVKGQRLFVAALGNHSVEVLDLAAGKQLHRISALPEPQGIAYLPELDRIVVASAGDGSCRFFDGRTYRQTAKIDLGEDADNVRYDAAAGCLYVGHGQGALAAIDLERQQRIADVPLPGHPESFQLEAQGNRIFVNLPTARQIAVIDRHKRAVTACWPVKLARANFPMALDEADHRLLVACREPARMLVFDTETGQVVSWLNCPGDADDLFFDPRQKRVYVTGGDGWTGVYEQADRDHYRPLGKVATAPGARTSLFVPATGFLYVAVPHRGAQEAAIWGYQMSGE